MKHATPHSRLLATLPLLLLLAVSSASAQETPAGSSAAKPAATAKAGQPVPRMPLVAAAPARAEWTVHMTSDFSDSGSNPAMMPPGAPTGGGITQQRTVSSIQYSKDTATKSYFLRTRWSDGDTDEEWIVMGCHVAERAGHRGFYIVGGESSTAADLSQADFPELAWVDMSLYRGLKTHKGKPAFVFSVPFDKKRLSRDQARVMAFYQLSDKSITPSKVFKPKASEVIVYLDAATQLPIEYNDGLIRRRYHFTQPTDDRLIPPAKIVEFLRVRNEALRVRLTPPAGPGTS